MLTPPLQGCLEEARRPHKETIIMLCKPFNREISFDPHCHPLELETLINSQFTGEETEAQREKTS